MRTRAATGTQSAMANFTPREVKLQYVPAALQLADMFTKALTGPLLVKIRNAIMTPARNPIPALSYFLSFIQQETRTRVTEV